MTNDIDILESIDYIPKFLDGVSEEEFYQNVEKQDAVLRRLEIIGEAVKHLPQRIRDLHPDVPWRQIAEKCSYAPLSHKIHSRPLADSQILCTSRYFNHTLIYTDAFLNV